MTDNKQDRVLVGAIDQGTSSSRFLVFDVKTMQLIASHQIECPQSYPNDGWVEMSPEELLTSTQLCIERVCEQLITEGYSLSQIKSVGITNQRETSIIWDKNTGKSLYPAIVWLDARTAALGQKLIQSTASKSANAFRDTAGLPIQPYFCALKLRWMLDNVESVKSAVKDGVAKAGTVDSWLIWHLTGGQAHVTDVTNASRYLLVDIVHHKTRQWSDELCAFFGVPKSILPEIRTSAEVYGVFAAGPLQGVPIAGCLGDQQAALVGHGCFEPSMGKCTYGTGCFMLSNTGTQPVVSKHGLLSTVAYQFGPDQPCTFALEGAGSMGGSAITWLRDGLGIIKTSSDVEALAESVTDCGSCVFVPCFSGLFAPHWKADARAIITGITGATTKAHIARAALTGVCCQTAEMLTAIASDAGCKMTELKVDGGMTVNKLMMQLQADIADVNVCRVDMPEVTALGAAIAAALALKLTTLDAIRQLKSPSQTFKCAMLPDKRSMVLKQWSAAVKLTFQQDEITVNGN